jgi:hypothetical protein
VFGQNIKEVMLQKYLKCNLKILSVSSDSLVFPDFDSSFMTLQNFYYEGISNEIPMWFENLNYLYNAGFGIKNLNAIKFNLCRMNNLRIFDISESDLYKQELEYKNKNGKYKTLQKFIDCNSELQFKYKRPVE